MGVIAAEFTSQYLVEFEDALPGVERAWRALELCWPYVRQQANAAMTSGAVMAPLPIELPITRPVPSGLPQAEQDLPSMISATVDQQTAAGRVLPLPSRLGAFLKVNESLQAIFRGERQWALSAIQLYGALLMSAKRKQPGVRLEVHGQNDVLLDGLLQRTGGLTLAQYRALEPADQRTLLSLVRQAVITLSHDAIYREADATTGTLPDPFQDEVEVLLDPPAEGTDDELLRRLAGDIAEDERAPMEDGEAPLEDPEEDLSSGQDKETDDPLARTVLYVTGPFKDLGQAEASDPSGVNSSEERIQLGGTWTLSAAGRSDILATTQVTFLSDDFFDEPFSLEEPSVPSSPSMYRVRHLHIDATAVPPLAFLTDLNLDDALPDLEREITPPFSQVPENQRWLRSDELNRRPWPEDGPALELAQLPWALPTTLYAFEAWLGEQADVTEDQLSQALRVPNINAEAIARHPNVTTALLKTLAEHPRPEVRRAVAEHPLLSPELLEQLWNDIDDVRLGLAENPALPLSFLQRLAHTDAYLVRNQVAYHPGLNRPLLQLLAEDDFWGVRCNVAGNPSTPDALLLTLVNDKDPRVSDEAQQALARRQLDQ